MFPLIHRNKGIFPANPLEDLFSFHSGLDHFFKNPSDSTLSSILTPAVDVFEKDNNIVVKAELPGLERDDIDIKIDEGYLTITGQKKKKVDVKESDYHLVETSYGNIRRSFRLPDTINTEKVQAGYTEGVLTITLPKKAESKPKQISVKVK